MTDEMLSHIKNKVCVTCLSSDRKLFPAKNLNQAFLYIGIQLSDNEDNVCWECKAMMNKFRRFKNRVLKAQALLRDVSVEGKYEILKSLSRLTTTTTTSSIKYMMTEKPLIQVEEYSEDFQQRNVILKSERVFVDVGNVKTEAELVAVDPENHDQDISDDEEHHKDNEDAVYEAKTQKDIIHIKHFSPSKIKEVRKKMYTRRALNEEEMKKVREEKRRSKGFTASGYKCEMCVESYSNQTALDHHMKKHEKSSGQYCCRICEQRFQVESDLLSHEESHYRCYECRVCGHSTDRVEAALYHYDKEHELRERACTKCGQRFMNAYKYRLHHRTVHEQRSCEHCGKEYSNPYNLKRHLMLHTDMPKFKCEICSKEYRGEWGLKAHMRSHDDKRNEAAFCAECGVQFKTVYNYRTHLKNSLKHVAAEDLKYKCQHCEKRFMSRAYLKCHSDSMHSSAYNYTCSTCNEVFKTTIRLRVHVREKHEGKAKPRNKVCEICSKVFSSKSTLRQHINSHVGARPYTCGVCGATFNYSGALYTHSKLLHQRRQKQGTQ